MPMAASGAHHRCAADGGPDAAAAANPDHAHGTISSLVTGLHLRSCFVFLDNCEMTGMYHIYYIIILHSGNFSE